MGVNALGVEEMEREAGRLKRALGKRRARPPPPPPTPPPLEGERRVMTGRSPGSAPRTR
jgi:hypothetical protein